MQKKNVVSLILTFLLSTGVAHAEITNKAFLMEIFNGCMSNDKDYDDLARLVGVGGTFEYCGCATNEMSKSMSVKDVMKVGLDVMTEGGETTEGGLSDKQFAVALRNKQLSNAIVECMSQVME